MSFPTHMRPCWVQGTEGKGLLPSLLLCQEEAVHAEGAQGLAEPARAEVVEPSSLEGSKRPVAVVGLRWTWMILETFSLVPGCCSYHSDLSCSCSSR